MMWEITEKGEMKTRGSKGSERPDIQGQVDRGRGIRRRTERGKADKEQEQAKKSRKKKKKG